MMIRGCSGQRSSLKVLHLKKVDKIGFAEVLVEAWRDRGERKGDRQEKLFFFISFSSN